MNIDKAVARAMEVSRIENQEERRKEFRKIMTLVRSDGYQDGSEDGYASALNWMEP